MVILYNIKNIGSNFAFFTDVWKIVLIVAEFDRQLYLVG
jgi:hypothetical protein